MRRALAATVATVGALGVVGIAIVAALAWPKSLRPASHTERDGPADAGSVPSSAVAPFIAFARHFEGFRTWRRVHVEGAMMPVDAPPGPSFVYARAAQAPGLRRWAVGSTFVKTIESGPPEQWTVHAMVKRGVPYNRSGALGWEYFELRLPPGDGAPSIVWRGTGPPSGHGYAARGRDAGPETIPLVCNDCHAAGWMNDGVLTPAFALGPP